MTTALFLLSEGTNTTTQTQAQPWESTVLMVLVIGVLFFMFWFSGRKQRKQQKLMDERRKNLRNGDRVMMTCGIYGTVTDVKDSVVTISTANGTALTFNKQYIAVVEYDDDKTDLSKEEANNANK